MADSAVLTVRAANHGVAVDDVLVAWGNATKDGSWHQLLFHGVDTAAVDAVLWRWLLGAPVRERVASGLGVAEEGALRWLRVLACLHDVGKATAFFQRLDALRWTGTFL